MSQYTPSWSTLQSQYTQQQKDYASLVSGAQTLKDPVSLNTAVNNIKAKNREIQATLDKMLRIVATSSSSSKTLDSNKQALLRRLRELTDDYNQLLTNNDTIETLRRIRAYEESKTGSKIQLYLMAFAAAVVLLLVVIFAMSYFKKSATMPTAAISPAMPSFT